MNFPPPLDRLKIIFRALLIAEIILSVILIPMSFGYGMMLEDPNQEVATVQPTAAEIMGAVVIGGLVLVVILAFLAALIVAWVGLFLYRPWARWLYVGVHTSGILFSIAFGVFDFSYQWGLIHSIETVSFFLAGCNVSLLFFSELSQAFDTSATETPVVASMADQT
jgi:glucan phosphoethanolaminetransferase (alkaline phosphatase superfamily)